MDISIRRIGAGDESAFEEIKNLLLELYPNNPPLSANIFEGLLDDEGVDIFVAELEKRVVGTASLAWYQKLGGKVFIIEDVVVSKGLRGSGIGHKLTEALLSRAKELSAEFVDVFTRREDAKKFYIKCGFHSKDEIRPFFALRYMLK
ncbi:MAG: hypothetical protein A3G49_04875 [Candidatus Sungbacteria bacterium RIFCSPLOWO2_12_FULL_41_11]|uniref:N-acetyltransferase domain-containing protein n=1 Tax=Candidatus Sungbacteria bacterium RIFCSPLOWO2_12_FULL_41_11 TaxID=1802286 RepID=A0A1G2LQ28_9BACT|nr:MAG: GCN5-related N-acetyltransferase [Parcubacteria group bacterium GW2011_GWA2_42_14]OGZ97671.1 MAG: hypothetical protein A3D41_03195 [Candidatus Sungbacteria bacterium RIFCSPHIGHO2_02_FULL_41_12b]OHA13707.1 MAG: hypothetical protein A3G49_04875 [Candidatus Sungbacteria bacterium RIFCSPLOWO2_12_FULL_41_11]